MPILLIRHSNTTYDDRVDALLDPPMDEEGLERSRRTIKFLRDYPISRIVSSPLQRAKILAEMLADGNRKVTTHNACLPWNLGDIMGKFSKEARPQIQRLLDYPDLKAPHGEPYRTFYLRWTGFLARLQQYASKDPSKYLAVTTHSRNINATVQEYLDGKPIGDVEEVTPEASVTLLAQTGSGDWTHELIWAGK